MSSGWVLILTQIIKTLFVSSPISQICLALSVQFKSKQDTEKCLEFISEISTNNPKTENEAFDDKLSGFLKDLSNKNNLIFYTASFIALYFEKRKHEEMFDLFTQLMKDYSEYQHRITDYNAGYLCGVFTTALISDLGLNDKDNIPEDIKEAIKYIESENYIVHLEKNVR